jgi:phosphoribosylformylglycinamidine synthase
MNGVKALVLTGFGLNCDYETNYSLKLAGAESHRVHINELVFGKAGKNDISLNDFHILVFGGGFSWADDHGAGVLMAAKIKKHLGGELEKFVEEGKLVLGICNGFQVIANLGLVPRFEPDSWDRRVALTWNDSGNFIDTWVNLKVNPDSPCIFTKGISEIELPVRHGEGKFYASEKDIKSLLKNNQVTLYYADENGNRSKGQWPLNPNGSLEDIAGICDPSGRIFGLMPHPEGFNHLTNHPNWALKKEKLAREGKKILSDEGDGIKIFKNAVEYIKNIF